MHSNAEVARRAYDAFLSGDMAAMSSLMTDDVVWHSPGNNPLSGTYRGREEVFGLFAKLAGLLDGPMNMDIHNILASDDHVVSLISTVAARGDKRLEGRNVHIMHISDGRIAEFWNYPEDSAAADAFFS